MPRLAQALSEWRSIAQHALLRFRTRCRTQRSRARSGQYAGECSVPCTHKRMLLHSLDDLGNAVLSKVKQVPEGKYGLGDKSSYFDPSTLPSCKPVIRSQMEAVAAMIDVRVQEAFPWKQKTRTPLGSYLVRSMLLLLLLLLLLRLLSSSVSSIGMKRAGCVARTESIIRHEKCSELSARSCEQAVK
jgi:hypothetical protein